MIVMSVSKNFRASGLWAFLLLIFTWFPVSADEKLKGIACRSVHLGYQRGSPDAVYAIKVIDRKRLHRHTHKLLLNEISIM